jgi:NADH-quinone oxidoreductase subunit F
MDQKPSDLQPTCPEGAPPAATSCELDLSGVDTILERYPRGESALVMVLQDVQTQYAYLPCEALEHIADRLGVPRTRVFSAATFYRAFSLQPQGRTVVQVCKGTACHVRGAQLLEEELARHLELPRVPGTTDDGAVTLRTVNCVGACAMAPVVIVGDDYHGEVNAGDVRRLARQARKERPQVDQGAEAEVTSSVPRLDSPAALRAQSDRLRDAREALKARLLVCGGPGCLAAGSRKVYQALRDAAAELKLPLEVELSACLHANDAQKGDDGKRLLTLTGCQGLCQQGPLVQLLPEDTLYTKVKPSDAPALLRAHLGGVREERLLSDGAGRADHPFYRGQLLAALDSCWQVDAERLEDYLAIGGFSALAHAIEQLRPAEVLAQVEKSGLRGRGGAGFAAARKWKTALRASEAQGRPPFVLCNGDEGDPGAFMDRAIMEGSPFQVIEGMLLGAFALGSREGYLYVRHEYPLAVERLAAALETCRAAGLCGEQILGSEFSCELHLSRGGGAFVCGESTALMRSIEGKVGEPRAKYVRSAERGLWDAPTVLNNVETWALVPRIIADGPAAFTAIGTERSSGTKAFSLTGAVRRTGLCEVPMGTSLRELVFEIGGGPLPGRSFKAVQTGGPSGGCLPASQLDLPVDFDALAEAGSMMGSGGMIVVDDQTCMVDVARYFVEFLREESCGKCTPCRLGLPQLSALLTKVSRGEAVEADLTAIEQVAKTMAENSLCGLGKSAPNPVLSTLQYFRDEYLAHLAGSCPAGVCRELVQYRITDDCTGCLACLRACPTQTIEGAKKELHRIVQAGCTQCGVCRAVCHYDAVEILSDGAVVVSAQQSPPASAAAGTGGVA